MQRLTRIKLSLLLSFAVCAALVLGLFVPAARAQQALNPADVDSLMQSLMKTYDVPGVGLAVVQNGKVTYSKGYGVRSTESSAPVSTDTLFAIGSVTKSFTALDVMQLVEQGKLDLDTPIIKYVPDFKLSDPDATKALTLRHLLSHTSGLPRTESWYFSKATLTRKQVIDAMATIPLSAKPGQLWQYNNQNFLLAGYIVEQVTGQTWEDYTQKHVLDPLGMKLSNFDTAISQKSADYAAGHALDVLKGMVPIPFSTKLGAIAPAGAINASVNDMAQYALFQLSNGTFNSQAIVSEKLLQTMHTQQIAIGAEPTTSATPSATMAATTAPTVPPTAAATPAAAMTPAATAEPPVFTNQGYGLAWFTHDYRGLHLIDHGGNIDGFSAQVTLIPSLNAGIVILTNQDLSIFPELASLKLIDLLAGLKPDRDLVALFNKALLTDPTVLQPRMAAARAYKPDPSEWQKYVGDYTSPLGKVNVAVKDGQLILSFDGPDQSGEISLVEFEPGQFLGNSGQTRGAKFSFKVDDKGTVTIYEEVYGQDTLIAERRAQGSVNVYNDPQGQYSFTVPTGLVAQNQNGLTIIQSTAPKGVFIVTAGPNKGSDLQAVVLQFIQNFDPSFKQTPDATKDVKGANGLNWTRYEYKLPSDQLLVVTATQQGSTVYIILLQAKSADIPALDVTLTGLISTFKVTTK